MFLFQFLKDFPAFAHRFLPELPGGVELWGSILLPGLVLGIVTLMPLWSRWRVGHWLNLLILTTLPGRFRMVHLARVRRRLERPFYRAASVQAQKEAARAKELARAGFRRKERWRF